MKYNRRKWVAVALAITTVMTVTASFAAGIPLARDLMLAGREAERACVPLLLEFSADDCHYCTLLEEEVLNPTLLNRDYEQRVLMRKLILDRGIKLRSFSGKSIHASDLASQYRVFVTPTLLFVDSKGKELAERMVGVTTLEFYGGYLDQALDTARDKLRKQTGCRFKN